MFKKILLLSLLLIGIHAVPAYALDQDLAKKATELSARADDKYVWANLRRDFEAIPRVMMQRRREEEAIGRAIDLRARGRLSPSGLAQLGYYEASLSAAEMGAPHAESANDLARSALEVMLKDGKLEAK